MKLAAEASLPVLALAALALAALEPGCREDETASATALFRESCTSCHVPPDPAFATERAWLEQVARTA